MGFPAFFLMVLALVIFLIVIVAVYFQIYKRSINKALVEKDAPPAPMASPYKVAIILTVVLLFVAGMISYFIGYKAAYDDFEYGSEQSRLVHETFYAEVKEVDGQHVLVQGLEINDRDYRGEYILEIYAETELTWHDTEISISDLEVGHIVSVEIYSVDGVIDTSTDILVDIAKIQILSDEK